MDRPDVSFGLHLQFDCAEPVENEHETVFPVKLPGIEHGMAVAYIDESPRHWHSLITETYYIMDGELDLELNGVTVKVGTGEAVTIRPFTVHCGRRHNKKTVCLLVFTVPPFTPDDYHLSSSQENIAQATHY